MKYVIWIITAIALIASFIANKKKTIKSLKMAAKRLLKITPLFFYVMVISAVVITAIPDKWIAKTLGQQSGLLGIVVATGIGSITMLQGFVAYPLCAMLATKGVTYMALAAFTMTLMNVGVVTFPLEQKYLGTKVAIIRNVIGLIMSIIVTIVIGIAFGEVLA